MSTARDVAGGGLLNVSPEGGSGVWLWVNSLGHKERRKEEGRGKQSFKRQPRCSKISLTNLFYPLNSLP